MLKYYEQKKVIKAEAKKNKKFINGTVFGQQYKENFKGLLISSLVAAAVMVLIIVIYPYVRDMYATLPQEFVDMYSLFGGLPTNIIEYFIIEGGQMYLLTGCIIAAVMGVNLIQKEIKNGSAEFLYSQPVSRATIFRSKLLVFISNILLFNLIVAGICLGTVYLMDSSVSFSLLNYFMYFGFMAIIQLLIGFLAFAYTAIRRRKASLGVAIGVSIVFYFVNMISLITDKVDFLKYLTPFRMIQGVKDSGDQILSVITNGFAAVDVSVLAIFSALTLVILVTSHFVFKKSDIL
ncbi:MAG: ABC transporter permease subunit [Spirochaetales bacterium]